MSTTALIDAAMRVQRRVLEKQPAVCQHRDRCTAEPWRVSVTRRTVVRRPAALASARCHGMEARSVILSAVTQTQHHHQAPIVPQKRQQPASLCGGCAWRSWFGTNIQRCYSTRASPDARHLCFCADVFLLYSFCRLIDVRARSWRLFQRPLQYEACFMPFRAHHEPNGGCALHLYDDCRAHCWASYIRV